MVRPAQDIPYYFHVLPLLDTRCLPRPNETKAECLVNGSGLLVAGVRLADAMANYWLSFASNHDPSHNNADDGRTHSVVGAGFGAKWPRFTDAKRLSVRISAFDDIGHDVDYRRGKQCRFWRKWDDGG